MEQQSELLPRVKRELDSFIFSIAWSNPTAVRVPAISIAFLPDVNAVPYQPKNYISQRSHHGLNANLLNEHIGQNNSSIKRIPK